MPFKTMVQGAASGKGVRLEKKNRFQRNILSSDKDVIHLSNAWCTF